jgi:hypothetical protein
MSGLLSLLLFASPAVVSLTPSAVPGTAVTVTLEGSGFDPASSVPEVYDQNGRLVATGAASARTATRLVATLPLAGVRPGAYTVKVLNAGGVRSAGTPLTLFDEVSVSPLSGRAGTVFTYAGRGFTPNFGVTSHLQRPDGLEFQSRRIATSAEGTFENQAIYSGEFSPGTYTLWAIDDATGVTTARVTFEVKDR